MHAVLSSDFRVKACGGVGGILPLNRDAPFDTKMGRGGSRKCIVELGSKQFFDTLANHILLLLMQH